MANVTFARGSLAQIQMAVMTGALSYPAYAYIIDTKQLAFVDKDSSVNLIVGAGGGSGSSISKVELINSNLVITMDDSSATKKIVSLENLELSEWKPRVYSQGKTCIWEDADNNKGIYLAKTNTTSTSFIESEWELLSGKNDIELETNNINFNTEM